MSQPEDKKPNGGNGQPQAMPVLTIGMEPNSREVVVRGPIANKPLCYEMIAKAVQAITAYNPETAEKKLITHVDPLAVPGMKGS